jgi:2,3-bisphosphoglycerate-independent phosphoglycerate mutase
MNFLFIFLDGVGLGPDNPLSNPLAKAKLPNLMSLFDGEKLVTETLLKNGNPIRYKAATLIGLDANLGVKGHPQSATGQASILTGINVSEKLGIHFGPWPNEEIRNMLKEFSIFTELKQRGYTSTLLNAYPQTYFERIKTGRRIPGAIAMSAMEAGIKLKTTEDLIAGKALSADFTGHGWQNNLNLPDIPTISLQSAGIRLAKLSREYNFAFFEYWISDYAGHRGDMDEACTLLENFDTVIGSLLSSWLPSDGLIFITSDHGNLEDTNTRGHTRNLVPGIVIGPEHLRTYFTETLNDLTDIAPSILKLYS